MSFILVAILIAATFSACGPAATTVPAPILPDSNLTQIAFSSNRDGNNEIYVINADGSGLTRLTNNPARDSYPAWSPDRDRIAFTSDREGNGEIYIMNADGSRVTRLTDNPADDWYAAWSADGKRIAFTSDYEIYVINIDGSELTNLTNNPAADYFPA